MKKVREGFFPGACLRRYESVKIRRPRSKYMWAKCKEQDQQYPRQKEDHVPEEGDSLICGYRRKEYQGFSGLRGWHAIVFGF